MPRKGPTPSPLTRREQDYYARLWQALNMKWKPKAEQKAFQDKVMRCPQRIALMRSLMPAKERTKKANRTFTKNCEPFTKPQRAREQKREEAQNKRKETMAPVWKAKKLEKDRKALVVKHTRWEVEKQRTKVYSLVFGQVNKALKKLKVEDSQAWLQANDFARSVSLKVDLSDYDQWVRMEMERKFLKPESFVKIPQ